MLVQQSKEKTVREMQIAASQTALNVAIVRRLGGTVAYDNTPPSRGIASPEILKISFKFPGHAARSVGRKI